MRRSADRGDRDLVPAQNAACTVATDAQVYFGDRRARGERGINENTNALLRQCLPTGDST